MNSIIKKILVIVSIILCCSFIQIVFDWKIDPNYSIKFSGKKVSGTFSGLQGKIIFNSDDLTNSIIDVSVDASTINTGSSTKDKHAKDEDWFDVSKYPSINFSSSSFKKSNNNTIVIGILELHGIKKEVQIPFKFSQSSSQGFFSGNFKVNRKEFGIKGNFFGFLVGNEIEITLQIPVSKLYLIKSE